MESLPDVKSETSELTMRLEHPEGDILKTIKYPGTPIPLAMKECMARFEVTVIRPGGSVLKSREYEVYLSEIETDDSIPIDLKPIFHSSQLDEVSISHIVKSISWPEEPVIVRVWLRELVPPAAMEMSGTTQSLTRLSPISLLSPILMEWGLVFNLLNSSRLERKRLKEELDVLSKAVSETGITPIQAVLHGYKELIEKSASYLRTVKASVDRDFLVSSKSLPIQALIYKMYLRREPSDETVSRDEELTITKDFIIECCSAIRSHATDTRFHITADQAQGVTAYTLLQLELSTLHTNVAITLKRLPNHPPRRSLEVLQAAVILCRLYMKAWLMLSQCYRKEGEPHHARATSATALELFRRFHHDDDGYEQKLLTEQRLAEQQIERELQAFNPSE
ncbi:hypothetical protein GMRT_12256 [Giardia muris]|uniref:Uncharacterized protein n=1 Tax=Giardia muris TaxID=5742 RepID=A0A4Z1TDH3_GIAMU|nr:hypothetical protein GMRT_12256 [Giardia muris]|eukprot:TNJ30589.1 hypothetical protein GMRT_12256 [Giardia muris]